MSIQSVSRAFTILRKVADHPEGIGVTTMARQMNVHKSTVSRLLATLELEEAVERLPNGSGYRIGTGIQSLLPPISIPDFLAVRLLPFLQELADEYGETVGLSVPQELTTYTVRTVCPPRNVQVRDWTGEHFPMHTSSSGKHFLAYFSAEKLNFYLSQPLERFSEKSITDPQRLKERLALVRVQGYDWTLDEFEAGLVAVSAPILDTQQLPIAAIYIGAPRYRFPPIGKRSEVTEKLVSVCNRASQTIQRYLAATN